MVDIQEAKFKIPDLEFVPWTENNLPAGLHTAHDHHGSCQFWGPGSQFFWVWPSNWDSDTLYIFLEEPHPHDFPQRVVYLYRLQSEAPC